MHQASEGPRPEAGGAEAPDPAHPAGPAFDPAVCEREAIHLPGAIQPHGAVLAALAADGRITHASANLADYLGSPPEALLGQPLRAAIGAAAWARLAELGAEGRAIQFLAHPPAGGMVHLRAHRIGAWFCLDLERPGPGAGAQSPLLLVQPVLESFKGAADTRALCELAVEGLRAMTGYDRAMVYRFGEQGHGEVFAEARDPSLEPYLGLRYPAADIPAQARRQYLRQSIGLIADAAYEPVALLGLGSDSGAAAAPLDLTYSSLRSVSPVHRDYMRNMGTGASMTVALAAGGGDGAQPAGRGEQLWGLLVCHHRQPRLPDFETRLAADMLGKVLSVLLASLQAVEADLERQRRRPALQAVLRGMTAARPLGEALTAVADSLLAIAGATGAVVRLSGVLVPVGTIPPMPVAERAMQLMQAQATGPLLATESLGALDCDFAEDSGTACGALLMRLGHGTDDAVLWFRPEQALLVTWGGNPAEHATIDPASGRPSPRRSFRAWQDVVRGRSLPWSAADLSLAQEVGHALEAEIGQRVRLELALVQEASRAKSRFMAGMSHELRTPLNGILGHAQLLSIDGGLGPVQTRRVEAMLSAGMHLLRIIGGVLELSEVESDHAIFEPNAFDPRAVATECLDLVRPMAEGKRLALSLRIAEDVPRTIITDPTRFRQIQLNLLGNAVKYTREGGVELRLRMAADGIALRVDVVDSGPGIDVGNRHRLFQAFQQLGGASDRAGSAGLGLAITARLVALLGGCLGHKENPDGGSIFWFELPLLDLAPPPPALPVLASWPDPPRAPDGTGGMGRGGVGSGGEAAQGSQAAGGRTLRLLVADDSAINRDVAQGFLRAAGHSVAFAEDGVEAVAAAVAEDFDLILMDVRMPRMGGLEATRRIRAMKGPRGRVPIVALTAQAFSEQIDECRTASMDGYLTKPFTMEGLLTAIANGMAARKRVARP